MKTITLPITNTGRKYGYITWRKKHDAEVCAVTGRKNSLDLDMSGERVTRKKIDWKRRRMGITYTLTRKLPPTARTYVLSKVQDGLLRLSFK